MCDVVRLFREAQLARGKRSQRATSSGLVSASTREQDEREDAKWWSQMVVPLGWLPVAVQFAKEGGYPGFNLGIMGVCGGLAGLGRTADLWASTAE